MSANNNNRYNISERSNTEQLMVEIFDKHFRPALREFSHDALVAFIHGAQVTPELDRNRFKQEIINFMKKITQSADAAINPPQSKNFNK